MALKKTQTSFLKGFVKDKMELLLERKKTKIENLQKELEKSIEIENYDINLKARSIDIQIKIKEQEELYNKSINELNDLINLIESQRDETQLDEYLRNKMIKYNAA